MPWLFYKHKLKSDNPLKIAIFKTSKIGLNKHLFKKKKSAINAEISTMVPLVRIGLTTPSLPMTCSTTEL